MIAAPQSDLVDIRVCGPVGAAELARSRLVSLFESCRWSGPYPSRKHPEQIRFYFTGLLWPQAPALGDPCERGEWLCVALKRVRESIAAVLADETADRQHALEQTGASLTSLIVRWHASPGHAHIPSRPMSPVAATRVEPEAALELAGLVHQQLTRLIREATAPLPSAVWQLAYSLVDVCELDDVTVAKVRHSVRVGRRLDMADGFALLNPEFGVPVDHWDGFFPRHRAVQAAAQRRELELSMGERFARMLAPACQGGEAP